MKSECDRVGDAICEYARFGTELSGDVRRHIARCPECVRVVSEFASLSGIIQAAACVPESPDCTNVVMSRISALPARRPVWVYAAGVLAVLVISGFLLLHPHAAAPTRIVRQETNPVVESPRMTEYNPPAVKHDIRPAILPRERTAQPKPRTAEYRWPRVRHRIPPKPMLARADSRQKTPSVTADQPPEQQPETVRRPIVAVAATWSVEPNPSNSYAYTRVNNATGETTTCRVEQSPGSVSIFMESKSSGEKPPSEGI